MATDRSKRLRRVAAVLVLSLVVVLGLAEIVLRVWDATHETSRARRELSKLDAPLLYAQHPFLGYVLSPGASGGQINSRGYRGPEFDVPKPPGVVRILCLGGSTTYCPEVKPEQGYPARLEAHLIERAPPGVRFEVINCGVPGYTSIHSLLNLELRLDELQPDVVVVYHGVNDARLIQAREYRSDYAHVQHGWRGPEQRRSALERWMLRHVRIWTWLAVWTRHGYADKSLPSLVFVDDYTRLLVPPVTEVNRAGVEDFLRNLRDIVAVARGRGVQVCLTTFATKQPEGEVEPPLRDCIEAMNAGIVALAAEQGVPLFDLRPALDDRPELYADFVHRNAKGCDLHARTVVEQAAAQGLWGLRD